MNCFKIFAAVTMHKKDILFFQKKNIALFLPLLARVFLQHASDDAPLLSPRPSRPTCAPRASTWATWAPRGAVSQREPELLSST